jgi:MFS family permease
MRIILGLLSGLLGMLAGWFGLAFLIVGLSAPDREGGTAMSAFFDIGPIGGVVGLIAGVWLFTRIGVVRESASSSDRKTFAAETSTAETPAAETSAPATAPRTRVSRPFAVAVVILAGGLAWWAWFELIRSPYLTHGFMTLDLQFRLPPGMALPPSSDDVQIAVEEGDEHAMVMLGASWHGHDGDRPVILATATLDKKTSHRVVSLTLPGVPEQDWRLDLSYDPDPTADYSAWRLPSDASAAKIEMNFRLRADR